MTTAKEWVSQARDLYRQGYHDAAYALVKQVLDQQPDYSRALWLLANIAPTNDEQYTALQRLRSLPLAADIDARVRTKLAQVEAARRRTSPPADPRYHTGDFERAQSPAEALRGGRPRAAVPPPPAPPLPDPLPPSTAVDAITMQTPRSMPTAVALQLPPRPAPAPPITHSSPDPTPMVAALGQAVTMAHAHGWRVIAGGPDWAMVGRGPRYAWGVVWKLLLPLGLVGAVIVLMARRRSTLALQITGPATLQLVTNGQHYPIQQPADLTACLAWLDRGLSSSDVWVLGLLHTAALVVLLMLMGMIE